MRNKYYSITAPSAEDVAAIAVPSRGKLGAEICTGVMYVPIYIV